MIFCDKNWIHDFKFKDVSDLTTWSSGLINIQTSIEWKHGVASSAVVEISQYNGGFSCTRLNWMGRVGGRLWNSVIDITNREVRQKTEEKICHDLSIHKGI